MRCTCSFFTLCICMLFCTLQFGFSTFNKLILSNIVRLQDSDIYTGPAMSHRSSVLQLPLCFQEPFVSRIIPTRPRTLMHLHFTLLWETCATSSWNLSQLHKVVYLLIRLLTFLNSITVCRAPLSSFFPVMYGSEWMEAYFRVQCSSDPNPKHNTR